MKHTLFTCILIVVFLSQNAQSQELTLFPGIIGIQYYQDNSRLTKSEFKSIIKTDEEASIYYKRFKVGRFIGVTTSIASASLFLYSINVIDVRSEFFSYQFASLGLLTASIASSIYANYAQKKSILSFNENLESSSFYIGPTNNGVGLVYQF